MGLQHFFLGLGLGVALTSVFFMFREHLSASELESVPLHRDEDPGLSTRPKQESNRVTLKINERDFTFVYNPTQTASDLAIEFCKTHGANLGFSDATIGDCIGPVRKGLESELQAGQAANGRSLDEMTVEATGAQIRRLPLTINDVVFWFEYYTSMQAELAAPKLAIEFCHSEKGRAVTSLGDTEGLTGIEERCVRPLQAALVEEIAKY
jgi:hypothetical protein